MGRPMPTYDYECGACGRRFEKFQSITAEPVRECALCGEPAAKRLIGTGAGIIFKGGGFYETDYRSDSYSKDAKKDSGDTKPDKAGKSDAKKSEITAESKPEAKPAQTKPAPKAEPAKSTS